MENVALNNHLPATLNSIASFFKACRCADKSCCRAASSPRPMNSARKLAMIESMISKRYEPCSSNNAATCVRSSTWCSEVQDLAIAIFSRTSFPSRPYLSEAICSMRSPRKVFSVSM